MEVTTPDGQDHSVSEIRLTATEARLLLRALEQTLAPDPEFEDDEDDDEDDDQIVIQVGGIGE